MQKRPAFLVALFAALVLPLALSGDARAPQALRGLFAPDAQAAIDPGKDNKNYDLASLDVFRKSVVYVKDNYVDPNRIDPKEMFVSALEAVEKQVPEVMVEPGTPDCTVQTGKEPGTAAAVPNCTAASPTKVPDGKVRVTVGSQTREFDYSDVDNIWKIPLKMREVSSFIKDNMVSQSDQRDIEYAAVNGMLTTLDPHSWLLKPDQYKEMNVQTRGEFGGLGFVISMRDDHLTVIKVLKNTPAFRAGVKKADVISQIDNDSVGGMDLSEAVDRMRGKVGSKVTIYVQHKGAPEVKKLDLTRGLINYETVTSKLLDNGIGYVRLASFSGTTTDAMKAAIKAMKAQNGGTLKGLIMDLRGNPGGLLDQAIKVSDVFVEDGTIVTTVGMNGQLRDPKLAHNDGGEREFPMAVLISSDSASASEMVAGALKNLNRALIVGRQSFGKGSVQLLYDIPDKDAGDSALKLTIAQYLTPGDISIQEVGITPDVELIPARVTKDRIDLFTTPKTFREQDYDKHFFNAFAASEDQAKESRARAGGTPFESLRYFKEETAKEKKAREAVEAGTDPTDDDDADPTDGDDVVLDYQIEFTRDLLGRATSTNRLEQLQQMKPFVAERRAAEQEKVSKALEGLGVDWSAPPPELAAQEKGEKAKVVAELRAPHANAGTMMDLVLTAHNNGAQPIYRLRASTKSDDAILDRREFVLGKLAPGEKKSWTVPVLVPRYTPSRRDDVEVKLEDDAGMTFDTAQGETDIAELPRPAFAWSWHLGAGSTDGLLRQGGPVELIVDVKNTGAGQALDAYAGLKNMAEDCINVKKGHSKIDPIKPGETRSVTFMLEAKKPLDPDGPVPVKLELGDRLLWDTVHQKLNLPVGAEQVATQSASAVRVNVDTAVLAAAQGSATKLAEIKKGAVLAAKGKVGEFYRVEWQKGEIGFLPVGAARETPGQKPNPRATALFPNEAPAIKLAGLDTSKGGLDVDSDHITVAGVASDPDGMRDLQIFVQHDTDTRKVFFRTAKKQGELQSVQGPTTLDFSTELALKPGDNTIFLVAREDDDLQGTRTLVIHRKQAPVLAQKRAER